MRLCAAESRTQPDGLEKSRQKQTAAVVNVGSGTASVFHRQQQKTGVPNRTRRPTRRRRHTLSPSIPTPPRSIRSLLIVPSASTPSEPRNRVPNALPFPPVNSALNPTPSSLPRLNLRPQDLLARVESPNIPPPSKSPSSPPPTPPSTPPRPLPTPTQHSRPFPIRQITRKNQNYVLCSPPSTPPRPSPHPYTARIPQLHAPTALHQPCLENRKFLFKSTKINSNSLHVSPVCRFRVDLNFLRASIRGGSSRDVGF
ncbi:hypothetical protein R3P38DRAFT_3424371 [Favolaschia claudopus]|uniref:Uncharacterized protein n=1 Tax=Favolaschia claudopus TaxID=2862362 RepID=A0AAV9ZXW0_9AGAR